MPFHEELGEFIQEDILDPFKDIFTGEEAAAEAFAEAERARTQALGELSTFLGPSLGTLGFQQLSQSDVDQLAQSQFPGQDFDDLTEDEQQQLLQQQGIQQTPFGFIQEAGGPGLAQQLQQQLFAPAAAQIGAATAGARRRAEASALSAGRDPAQFAALTDISGAQLLGQASQQATITGTQQALTQQQQALQNIFGALSGAPVPQLATTPSFLGAVAPLIATGIGAAVGGPAGAAVGAQVGQQLAPPPTQQQPIAAGGLTPQPQFLLPIGTPGA